MGSDAVTTPNGAGAGSGGADPNLPLHRPRGKHAAVGAAPGPNEGGPGASRRGHQARCRSLQRASGQGNRGRVHGRLPIRSRRRRRVSTRRLVSSASRGVRSDPYGCGWECTAAWPRRARATTTGPTVNRAARIMGAGHGGQVLLSSAAAALVVDALPDGATLCILAAIASRTWVDRSGSSSSSIRPSGATFHRWRRLAGTTASRPGPLPSWVERRS